MSFLIKLLTSVACVAKATHVLHGVPRSGVNSAGLGSEVLFRPASAAIIAILGTQGALAGNPIVTRETRAGTSFPVAHTLVAALLPRVNVVSADDGSDPCIVLGAHALGAIGASPLWLA